MASMVLGLESVLKKLDKLQVSCDRGEAAAALIDSVKQMQRDVVSFAPVKTGKLRRAFESGEALLIVRNKGQIKMNTVCAPQS